MEMEQELLGMTHCDIATQLGKHWGLPEEIIAVLHFHHSPDDEAAAEGQPLVNMINLVEKMLSEFGKHEATEQVISDQEWQDLGIDPIQADDIRIQISEVAEQAKNLAAAV
jgi:HD-like signal output (HDOD) protein